MDRAGEDGRCASRLQVHTVRCERVDMAVSVELNCSKWALDEDQWASKVARECNTTPQMHFMCLFSSLKAP